jgi:hypothetical protein
MKSSVIGRVLVERIIEHHQKVKSDNPNFGENLFTKFNVLFHSMMYFHHAVRLANRKNGGNYKLKLVDLVREFTLK